MWGVVEGRGDRTKAFDALAVEEAAMAREEGEDLWLFTSEGENRKSMEAAEQLSSERTVESIRL